MHHQGKWRSNMLRGMECKPLKRRGMFFNVFFDEFFHSVSIDVFASFEKLDDLLFY